MSGSPVENAPVDTKFNFDLDLQRQIVRLFMLEDSFAAKAIKHVDPRYFTTEPLGWVFKMVREHWDTYGHRISDAVLRSLINALPPEKYGAYAVEAELLLGIREVLDEEFIRVHLRKFVHKAMFTTAHRDMANLHNAGRHDDALALFQETAEAIRLVTFDVIDRQWFFSEFDDRQRGRTDRASQLTSGFPTSIPELNQLSNNGVQPGEIWAVLAYAKRCKTTWLINQAIEAVRFTRKQVLHVALENRSTQTGDKFDSAFAGAQYNDVRQGQWSREDFDRIIDEYRDYKDLLVIRTINEFDVNVLDVENELKELKARRFVPRMITVDYMDLLRSRTRADTETQQQVNAARDLKRLVLKYDLACWTAWQAQRPPKAYDETHVLTSANVADAYAKVRIVDAYGTLNATDEEMSEGKMRLYMEAHRDNPMGKCWLLTNDLATNRMAMEAKLVDAKTSGESQDDVAKPKKRQQRVIEAA